jgi:carbamoyl-phosphate synthase large subunit
MNVQFAIQNDVVYVLEVNPRASRTVPFVSKATGLQLAKIAARCMAGQSLASQGVTKEVIPPYFSVKEAVFPFNKFPGVDTILGPEMKSTGEVMGVGLSFEEAFVKSQMAASVKLPSSPARSSSASRIPTRARSVEIARDLHWQPASPLSWRRAARRRQYRSCRVPGDGGQQGDRRSSAHCRYDQEQRNCADHQHR